MQTKYFEFPMNARYEATCPCCQRTDNDGAPMVGNFKAMISSYAVRCPTGVVMHGAWEGSEEGLELARRFAVSVPGLLVDREIRRAEVLEVTPYWYSWAWGRVDAHPWYSAIVA